MSQVTSYPLTLLKLMDERYESTGQPPLGIARRVGVESSTFDLPAHKILQALITHAQSPETIAKELLIKLGKCGNGHVKTLAEEVYGEVSTLSADEWAVKVLQELQESESPGDLSTVTQLGSHYLSHLVIPFRNPGGRQTPQDSVHSTPNRRRIEEIEDLLTQATSRSQSALKDLESSTS
ncbi:hypothetical protein F5887DRAFT_1077834 [Amanita rubescens]|nr:hypothetical protein F5887DRAFT_1077834 [Amanita rubescens]